MNERRTKLYMLAGLWLSLVGVMVAASTLIPLDRTNGAASTALVYRFAASDRAVSPAVESSPGRALIVDLDVMQIMLYEDGGLVKTFPVLSKGRGGTPWETPTGKYVIQKKEIKHYSSIGGTWMPYSMQFYGNFFIHGWPTYPDGRDVPVGYSGGCIRLSTDDVQVVYEFAAKGTKLLVLGARSPSEFATSSRYYMRGEGVPPGVTSPSFAVVDIDEDTALWVRSPDEPRRPSGLVSLLTGLTALETVNQYKIVRMSELLIGTYTLRKYSIGAVDEMPIGTLIYPLLFDANDTAARVFAREHGTTQFVRYMNEKARAIGLTQSEFRGVLSSDEATTTARDLFTLLQYVEKNKHFLLDVTLAEEQVLTDKKGKERYEWSNKNPWIISGDGEFRGGIVAKNTDGTENAMVLFSIPLAEFGSRTIAFVILDSKDVVGDVSKLRSFVVTHFTYGIEPEENNTAYGTSATSTIDRKNKGFIDLEKLFQDELNYERGV